MIDVALFKITGADALKFICHALTNIT